MRNSRKSGYFRKKVDPNFQIEIHRSDSPTSKWHVAVEMILFRNFFFTMGGKILSYMGNNWKIFEK